MIDRNSFQWTMFDGVRKKLLAESDYTQMPDYPMDNQKKKAWAEYRQKLRDMPQTYSDLKDMVFPEPPE